MDDDTLLLGDDADEFMADDVEFDDFDPDESDDDFDYEDEAEDYSDDTERRRRRTKISPPVARSIAANKRNINKLYASVKRLHRTDRRLVVADRRLSRRISRNDRRDRITRRHVADNEKKMEQFQQMFMLTTLLQSKEKTFEDGQGNTVTLTEQSSSLDKLLPILMLQGGKGGGLGSDPLMLIVLVEAMGSD